MSATMRRFFMGVGSSSGFPVIVGGQRRAAT
jgi:phosphoribosyl 1,2-cyclic phosphodiesterase